MRKVVSILVLIVVLLPLAACGSSETKLTLENYEDYMKVTANALFTDSKQLPFSYEYYSVFGHYTMNDVGAESIEGWVDIEGVAPNYNFNDVRVKVRITGTYIAYSSTNKPEGELKNYEVIVEAKVNKAGYTNDTAIGRFSIPNGFVGGEPGILGPESEHVEIIEITGTVSPA